MAIVGRESTTKLAGEAAGAAARGHPTGLALRGAVIERVMSRVLASFRRLVRDPADAEECAQRTLLLLERSLREGTYDPARSFNAWVWVKAHSVFLDLCRERGRRMEALSEYEPGTAPLTPSVERRLDAEAALAAIEASLGAEALACFVLRYEGDLSLDEIAATVGRDRKTVTGRIQAAHRIVDRLFGKEDARA